ncbi:MAG: response regulator [Gammaproteobacteria bacterium]|nr:response regulator [Gammaproteobacteria bacterium]
MSGQRILVVDDQSHINRILKRSLAQKGYVVETASHGKQALDMLREESFDAIITDYQMPHMDGVTLCEAYTGEFPGNATLMILSTAVADEKLQEWAERMPNTLYLEKPVSMRRLSDILSEYFSMPQRRSG